MPIFELVSAPEGSASSLAEGNASSSQYRGHPCKPLDLVKLSTLSELLGDLPWEAALNTLEPVASSDEGPWVSELPRSLLDRVTSLSLLQRWRVAAKWGSSEEFVADRIGTSHARKFLSMLESLSRESLAANERVYLRVSL